MKTYKNIQYYLNLPWTYTVERETDKNKSYYIIRVNELPGICTDNEDLNEGFKDIKDCIEMAIEAYKEKGQEIPIPISREQFKGKIPYRTDSERHYRLVKASKLCDKSISKTIDMALDVWLNNLNV